MKTGVGFSGLLTLIFITLKLIGCLTWSWIWVLSPIWITWGLISVFILGIMFVIWINKPTNKKKNK